MATFKGSGLGWTFEADLDQSGRPTDTSLRNIRHDGHNFARDLRFIGLWLNYDHVGPDGSVGYSERRFVTLLPQRFTISAAREIVPTSMSHPSVSSTFQYLLTSPSLLNFSDYFQDGSNTSVYGLSTIYDAPQLFQAIDIDNCEMAGLTIELAYLFSRYGTAPAHEPSGNLAAARCHPMATYSLAPNTACDRSKTFARITSIRFDYRVQFQLDRLLNSLDVTVPSANQAGLFADSDKGSFGVIPARVRGTEHAAFYAAEKPLVREVTAPGLINGGAEGTLPGSTDKVICWDNIHWWSAQGPGQPLISTPGAFHAAHLHWRWGKVLSSYLGRAKANYWRRFQPGDALLDPRIPLQTLFVAVTKRRDALDPAKAALVYLSEPDWQDLFHDRSGNPAPETIEDGDNLVLWYSTEVQQLITGIPPAGTVFLHGIFFAHDPEPQASPGPRDPLYFPTKHDTIAKAAKWFRKANG